MADLHILSRPAITAGSLSGKGIMITAPRSGAIIQILGPKGIDLGKTLAQFAGPDAPHAVRPLAPDQWLLVLSSEPDGNALSRLQAAVGDAALIDQTHGRARICLEGINAARILAKGTAVDLHLSAFPAGSATTTLFGHIAAHMTRTDEHRFELLVLRGFAESLWEDLSRMAAEFL